MLLIEPTYERSNAGNAKTAAPYRGTSGVSQCPFLGQMEWPRLH